MPISPGVNAARFGEDPDGVDVGELALIGRHARRCVAFGEFDMVVAFAHRESDIVDLTSF